MVGKKMVSLRAKIREMLRLVKKEKGGFLSSDDRAVVA